MTLPQRRVTDKPWWRRPLFWFAGVLVVLLAGTLVAVIVSAFATGSANRASEHAKKASDDAKAVAQSVTAEVNAREAELRSLLCGVYVPLGNAPLPPSASVLGRTIVAATRKAALELHCPGIK